MAINPIRLYPGISVAGVDDTHVESALRAVDSFLRDVSPTLKTLSDQVNTLAGGGAAASSSFVTALSESLLPNARQLAATSPITVADGGGGAQITLGLNTSVLGAVPTGSYGTGYTAGFASTFIRTDAQLKYPKALISDLSGMTGILSDDATDMTLAFSSGKLNLNPAAGLTINIGANNVQGVSILPNAVTAPLVTCTVSLRPGLGNSIGLRSQFFSGDTSSSNAAWDAVINPSGVFTGAMFSGFYSSTYSLSPSAGSDNANKMYGINLGQQFRIANANAGFTEVATAYFKGVTRLIGTPTITTQAGVIIEPPTAATSDQFGLLIRQQTAQATATNRTGIRIDSQNSGTNRLAIDARDRVKIMNPNGVVANVLELIQSNGGGTSAAHINFDNPAANPSAPSVGDLWRNGSSLFYRKDGSTTIDLANPAASPGVLIMHQAEIDLGATPVADASIAISDASITSGAKITPVLAYEAPTGKDIDEIGMDALLLTAGQASPGQFILYVRGLEGYIHDKFLVNYVIG